MDAPRTTRVIGIFAPVSPDARLGELVEEAEDLRENGADVVDLDTLPGGPFAGADEERIAGLVRGLRDVGVAVCLTTTDAGLAAAAIGHGAEWVLDPSGTTADPVMIRVAADSAAGWVIGPWSPRPEDRHAGGDGIDAYTDGLVRNLAALLDAGVRSDRIVLDVGAGLTATDPEPWRTLNHLERIAALGYPLLVDARDEILVAMSSDDAAERLADAAVGLTVLAAGIGAWGIRTRGVGRVAGVVQRILEPRQRA